MKYDLSLIIPVFNEQDNLANLFNQLEKFFNGFSGQTTEVIFVDDGSTDGSANALKNYSPQFFDAKVIVLSKNFGSHSAMRAGISVAQGKLTTFTFADLQDPLELISSMQEKCDRGADVVWATRIQATGSFFERISSRMYADLMRKFVSQKFPDNGFDVVMFNDKVKTEINRRCEANSSLFLQILSFGYRQETVAYKKLPRTQGSSKWTLSKKFKLFLDSFIVFSHAPARFVSALGCLLATAGFCWAGYVFFRALLYKDMAPGWPALICVLLIGFGMTNISLGILAEYLWRILDTTRGKSVFIITESLERKRNA